MTFRKLRIAWSVFWGLACVLLVVLWVLVCHQTEMSIWGNHRHSYSHGKVWSFCCGQLLVGGMVAALPWIRWRFSIRTLLIATTLVAVVLGLAVYAVSK